MRANACVVTRALRVVVAPRRAPRRIARDVSGLRAALRRVACDASSRSWTRAARHSRFRLQRRIDRGLESLEAALLEPLAVDEDRRCARHLGGTRLLHLLVDLRLRLR